MDILTKGFTYGQLDRLLAEYGFSETKTQTERFYRHPTGSQFRLPPLDDDEPVRSYHLTAIRATFSDYGILPYEVFDMKILPYLVNTGASATH